MAWQSVAGDRKGSKMDFKEPVIAQDSIEIGSPDLQTDWVV